MPRPEQLTIHTHDIQKVIDALEAHQYTGQYVILVDNGNYISVRDQSEFLITSISKTEKPKSRTHG